MKIVVAGTGYVGLVTGVCLAKVGHNVVCIDINEEKIYKMKNGISPIYEPGLEEIMVEMHEKGNLNFTTDYKNSYKNADVIFIGVGTPEKADGSANLEYIYKVVDQIIESAEKSCLVVIKSTVPIGTNKEIELYINEKIAEKGIKIEVASNPEFLAQGTAVNDTLHAKRIVVGVESEDAKNILREIYEPFNIPIVITNRESAEMIKYASNDFLALKISFMNEIANLCEIIGANIEDVAKGMSYDDRIGKKFLKAGVGYGGSCFPKDTKALHWLAENNGHELKTIKATIEVNENQKYKLLKKSRRKFKSFKNLNVAFLGLTFKPGTDDLREAPSIPNMRVLLDEGANIKAYDPVGVENFKKIFKGEKNLKYVQTPEEALEDADVAFVFTEWKQITGVELKKYKELMKKAIIFDGRNCYKLEEAISANVEYHSIGRNTIFME
ncbi:UDPglucose 6-dehydrogenase [Clostridium cavendishii DSM 21758]|uniref:UDP-glucose 6-dehydrogenase n=1 Tax=Clostridium cavendishii DSM 21758 TaxID=1121302 RepID=A0A1M6Q9W1_9CLOT|nr:UDP-glucose/GDP-mannose dehydrogenase family protein [Clostridium cavendishii]SHK16920.1 UDPglucose 6-dehydrogenase [Clostridium cavendishii DSM 21758]